jgi:hypothetical protein
VRSSASPLILAFGSRTFGAAGAADAVDEGMRLALAYTARVRGCSAASR